MSEDQLTITGIDAALKAVGGSQAALARSVGLSKAAIGKWVRDQKIPVERVPEVADATGVPRHVLRPDFWDVPAVEGDAGGAAEEAAA